MIRLYGYLRLRFSGVHQHLSADGDLRYLRSRHRHTFGMQIVFSRSMAEVDLEPHRLKNIIAEEIERKWLGTSGDLELGDWTTEKIGIAVLAITLNVIGERSILIEISEDGESGARLFHLPDKFRESEASLDDLLHAINEDRSSYFDQ